MRNPEPLRYDRFCIMCGEEFKARRCHSKFCGRPGCAQKYSRESRGSLLDTNKRSKNSAATNDIPLKLVECPGCHITHFVEAQSRRVYHSRTCQQQAYKKRRVARQSLSH